MHCMVEYGRFNPRNRAPVTDTGTGLSSWLYPLASLRVNLAFTKDGWAIFPLHNSIIDDVTATFLINRDKGGAFPRGTV